MGSTTDFLIGFWEENIEAKPDVECPELRRVIAYLKKHRDEHGGWPELVRISDLTLSRLERETNRFMPREFQYWAPGVKDVGNLFDCKCEVVDTREPEPQPRGILDMTEMGKG